MSTFYLPYQFVPVTGKVNGEHTPVESWDDAISNQARHDLWRNGTCSGRIICRLHLATPTFVGNGHFPDGNPNKNLRGPTYIEPYERNGDYAIPANSLRGMVASLAEALSQSALRVLEKRHYSVRKPMKKEGDVGPLSAVGRILKEGDHYKIEPLTLPVITKARAAQEFQLDPIWQQVFKDVPLCECLAAYVNGYEEDANHNKRVVYGTKRSSGQDTFLKRHKPKSALGDNPNIIWYANPRNNLTQTSDQPINSTLKGLHIKNDNFLTGQELIGDPQKGHDDRHTLPGFLRVLGIEGRETELPTKGKKHELFIPRPATPRVPVPIPEETLRRFSRLVVERNRVEPDRYPFFPKGYEAFRPTKEHREQKSDEWRPEPGMLVYFDVKKNEETGELSVCELSLSSIWRREIDGSSYDFFQAIDPDAELLPWGNEKRRGLTPAEVLFGVVQEERQNEKDAHNLASRVHFSDALPNNESVKLATEVRLKTLGGPKPPSPALYFHPTGERGGYVSKQALNKTDHRPNGRKVYLHHPQAQIDAEWWRSRDPDSHNDHFKVCCQPMEAGQDLWFHIDFDNLTPAELTLLRTSLTPDPAYHHRLGLGKSLGLGTVQVVTEGILIMERKARYSLAALTEQRPYHRWYRPRDAESAAWPERYAKLVDISGREPMDMLLCDPAYIDLGTLETAIKLGSRECIDQSLFVHTPLTESQCPRNMTDQEQQKAEKETYKWFVANDKVHSRPQSLPLQQEDGDPLPTLFTWAELQISGLPDRIDVQAIFSLFHELTFVHDVSLHKKQRSATVWIRGCDAERAIQRLDGLNCKDCAIHVELKA